MPKPITSCAKCGCQACRCNTQNEVINERSGYIEHNSHAAEAVLIEETGGMVSKAAVLVKLKQPIYFNDHFHSPDYRRGYTDSNKDAIAAIEAMPCGDDKYTQDLETVITEIKAKCLLSVKIGGEGAAWFQRLADEIDEAMDALKEKGAQS